MVFVWCKIHHNIHSAIKKARNDADDVSPGADKGDIHALQFP